MNPQRFWVRSLVESPFCGLHISAHALLLDSELAFYLKSIYFLENDLELPLVFVLFLKGKQNKKENPKYDSLFGKDDL